MTTKKPDHASRGHHPQGPSQLKNLQTCPGFENNPGTSAAAEMGTRIHEALEIRDPSNLESELEVELYELCVKAEDKLIAEYFGDEEYDRFNELPLTIPLNSGREIWGTGDVLCLNKSRTRGLGIDYKTGRMQVDDAEDNLQAWAYTLGAFAHEECQNLETLRFIFLAPQINVISQHDFDVDSMPIRRQEITEIVAAAQAASEAWAKGEIWRDFSALGTSDICTFCRHHTYCPAVHGMVREVAEKAGIPVPEDLSGETADPEIIAQRYTLAKLLEPLVEKFKKEGVRAAQEGEVLPGWELRSMGAQKLATDNTLFYQYALTHGVSLEDLLSLVNVPVAKVRDLVKSRAKRGEKSKVAEAFEREALDMGCIKKGTERFTLRPERADD